MTFLKCTSPEGVLYIKVDTISAISEVARSTGSKVRTKIWVGPAEDHYYNVVEKAEDIVAKLAM